MSLLEEEAKVYSYYTRPVATAINQFSLFSFSFAEEDDKATLRFGEGTEGTMTQSRGKQLREYQKATLKELKTGPLNDSSEIQRRMYWWMSRLVEWSVIPHTHWQKVMNFYQMSVWELEEK